MTTRTITAMFNSREQAEHAAKSLASEIGVDQSTIKISPESGGRDDNYDKSNPYAESGYYGSLKGLSVADADRFVFAEGMRRGNSLMSAKIDDSRIEQAEVLLERENALDLDEQESSWRQSGWTGYDQEAHRQAQTTRTVGQTGVSGGSVGSRAADQDGTINVVEERLVVGKRDVNRGSVRVRSYVVEKPVEEQVTLHDETVKVDRQSVDRALKPGEEALFTERTIEARTMHEEAVVNKEARVVEEVSLHKEAQDRTETVRDTVRHTEVDVDRGRQGDDVRATGRSDTATKGAPDGTPGNPPGTMASRGVDKALGTNISGDNPKR